MATRSIEERIARQQAELERLTALADKQAAARDEAVGAVAAARTAVEAHLDTVASDASIDNAKLLREAVAEFVTLTRKLQALKK